MCGPCIGKFGISQLSPVCGMWISKVPLHVGCVLWCGVDFPIVLERLSWRDFLSNFTVQSSHTQMIFEKFQRFHTPQFGVHTGKFSNIVIFPKQIQSFFIGNFLSIWPIHKEFFPYMRIFRKINPLWYESFEKVYEGFLWSLPTKFVYLTILIVSVQIEQIFPGLRPEPQIYTE